MGSVMVWNDNGTERETLILDMQYHNQSMNWNSFATGVSGITNYTSTPFKNQSDNYYILGSSSTTPSDYNGQTDAVLDAKFNWRDEHTSKENTDAASTLTAFAFCRNIKVNGVGCDLPNMQTLVRIFCDRATIHSLDSSDTSDRWSSWFDGSYVWSSSEYSSGRAWCVRYDGYVYNYGKGGSKYCVVPVQNL